MCGGGGGGGEATAFMVALSSGTDPMDSLTGQPRSPNSELHTQTSAVPTPPTGKLYVPCVLNLCVGVPVLPTGRDKVLFQALHYFDPRRNYATKLKLLVQMHITTETVSLVQSTMPD